MSVIKKSKKMCDICHKTTDIDFDVPLFGDWMKYKDVTVHYYCLLLSTKLPQNGRDFSGILGFLLRDIRTEINLASKRQCVYCKEHYASIACFKCKQYFHLECGLLNMCLFKFCDDFRSYCDTCLPLDDTQSKLVECPPSPDTTCSICKEVMGTYNPTLWIYGRCCGNGYVHRLCMQKYASAAGYYLVCIWCKNRDFREEVKKQGIFVPDRDANWERQKGAFNELHRGHNRCDIKPCLCPRGRDYIGYKGKWSIILCALCGSSGGHNPICITGNKNSSINVKEFKCDLCAKTEACMQEQHAANSQESVWAHLPTDIDKSMFQIKRRNSQQNETLLRETPTFSEDTVSNSSKQNEATSSISSSTDMTETNENFAFYDMYEFDSEMNCLGTCTIRIDFRDPRFADKSIEEIKAIEGLIEEKDIIARNSDIGVFAQINDIINEYIN